MNNIRRFGNRWVAIRRPSEGEEADFDNRMIRVSDTEWVDPELGIRAFGFHAPMITREIILVANRAHYEGAKPDDFGPSDVDDRTIFCINYAVTPVLGALERFYDPDEDMPLVLNFWQDTVPKPTQRFETRVYGELIPGGDIRISPLAFGFHSTPRTIELCVAVAKALGVEHIELFNANPEHPDTALALQRHPMLHPRWPL